MERSVIAIVVLYNNRDDKVVDNIKRIAEQVDLVCLIDNSNDGAINLFTAINKVVYLPQYRNLGIAAAQNIGIQYAINENYEFILFSDPDSVIPVGAVDSLYFTYQELKKQGYKVGGVGSVPYNEETGEPYHNDDRNLNDIGNGVIEVSYLMNSISLIPTSLFKTVGLMEEALFIDGVDGEWCWRAKKNKSVTFYMDNKVPLKHNLGVGTQHLGKIQISISSPTRLYYQYRNYIWLRRRDYVPIIWKKINGEKYLIKIVYYLLFVKPRAKNLKYILKGIKDGIMNG